jgi:hypothetical protein
VASLEDDFVPSGDETDVGRVHVAPFATKEEPFAAAVWDAFAGTRAPDVPEDLDAAAFVRDVNEPGDDCESALHPPATPERAFRIASVLFRGGARHEAYAVFVHGLSLESVDVLTTEGVVALLPLPVLDGLAAEAEARGDHDIAGFLEAVAVVAAGL